MRRDDDDADSIPDGMVQSEGGRFSMATTPKCVGSSWKWFCR